MRSQTPAIASSTELSTTSQTQWWRPDGPVEPMYMPGRLRTGSRPSRTCMSLAPYERASLRQGAPFQSGRVFRERMTGAGTAFAWSAPANHNEVSLPEGWDDPDHPEPLAVVTV